VGAVSSERAASFNEWARRGAGAKMEDAHQYAGKKVLDRIEIGYDQSFIDLGCGNGWAVRFVAQRVPTIGLCVGVDVAEELVNEARRISAGKYPVKFLVAPMEALPFGESSFNHAFSMEAFYYVEDPLVALKAVWKLLKMGGRFHLVIDFYKENPMSAAWQADIPIKMHFLSEAEWVQLFNQAGFADVKGERILDDRPVAGDLTFPWGGFKSREDLVKFRTKIGSLYVRGTKTHVSPALDPFLERAKDALAHEGDKAPRPAAATEHASKKKRRFGRR